MVSGDGEGEDSCFVPTEARGGAYRLHFSGGPRGSHRNIPSGDSCLLVGLARP